MSQNSLITAVVFALGFNSALAFAGIPSKGGSDGFLVKVKRGASRETVIEELREQGVQVRSQIGELNLLVTDKAPKFAKGSFIEYVEPNFYVETMMGSGKPKQDIYDREANRLWGLQATHAAEAWRITTGSRDVVLAISDTGTWEHPEIVPNLWENPGETGRDAAGRDKRTNGIDDDGNGFVDDVRGWNFEINNNNPSDDHFHGTHVSGIVGALGGDNSPVAGVNWATSIMSLKFIGREGYGTEANGIRTIIYAASNGAKAMNCSWGGDGNTQALLEAVEYAKSKGMLIIAAAGNYEENSDVIPIFPAGYESENIISVAATMNREGQLASFSNYGAKSVDLAAPGELILSTFNPTYSPLHKNWYELLSGTSMAAPQVTGAVGLIYSVNPRLSWREVKEIILSTVRPSAELQGRVLTGGMLDVGAAVRKAKGLL